MNRGTRIYLAVWGTSAFAQLSRTEHPTDQSFHTAHEGIVTQRPTGPCMTAQAS